MVQVCKHAASTKEEWEEQCKLWPTSFHPPTYNIDGIAGFSEEDSLSIFNFMKLAVGIAKSGIQVVNAAVIVDPTTRQVIASATDQVLSCYDSLSKSEHPEADLEIDATEFVKDPVLLPNCSSFYNAEQSYKDVSCLNPWGWIEQQSHVDPNSWHPLHHAAIVAIENSAARDRLFFPLAHQSAESAQEECNASSPIGSPLKRQKITMDATDEYKTNGHCGGFQCDSTRPYLCTGYDIYFVWEPCVMCAMAIVHQRVKRVFYAFPNPNNGALGSVHRLQGERSLNHHYAVFRVVMPEDILETAQQSIPSKMGQSTVKISE